MRKILFFASAGLILLACNNSKTESDNKMASGATDSSAVKQQAEFADAKYTPGVHNKYIFLTQPVFQKERSE